MPLSHQWAHLAWQVRVVACVTENWEILLVVTSSLLSTIRNFES